MSRFFFGFFFSLKLVNGFLSIFINQFNKAEKLLMLNISQKKAPLSDAFYNTFF